MKNYFIKQNGQEIGPLKYYELISYLNSTAIQIWYVGSPTWINFNESFAYKSLMYEKKEIANKYKNYKLYTTILLILFAILVLINILPYNKITLDFFKEHLSNIYEPLLKFILVVIIIVMIMTFKSFTKNHFEIFKISLIKKAVFIFLPLIFFLQIFVFLSDGFYVKQSKNNIVEIEKIHSLMWWSDHSYLLKLPIIEFPKENLLSKYKIIRFYKSKMENDQVYIVNDNSNYKVVNGNNEILITPSRSIEFIDNNQFLVEREFEDRIKSGIVDKNNKVVLPFIYRDIKKFDDHYLLTEFNDKGNISYLVDSNFLKLNDKSYRENDSFYKNKNFFLLEIYKNDFLYENKYDLYDLKNKLIYNKVSVVMADKITNGTVYNNIKTIGF